MIALGAGAGGSLDKGGLGGGCRGSWNLGA